jgi:RHS repeat-associated protein
MRGAVAGGRGGDAVYPNGVNTSYSYDNLNRLLRLKADKDQAPITDFQYVYDAAGNRTRKQQLDYTEDYEYDPLYRLTGAQRSAGLTGLWQYGYDAVGNRTFEQKDSGVTSYGYNEKNQLLSTTGGGTLRWRGSLNEPGSVTFTSALVNGQPARILAGNVFEADIPMASGANTVTVQATDVNANVTTKSYSVSVSGNGATYTYDANGNLSQKVEGADTWVYEWNAENELKRVTKNSVEQARFAYDPLGRRVEGVESGAVVMHAYDDEEVLRETRGSVTRTYVDGPWLDEPLLQDDGVAAIYLLSDDLGSVAGATDSVGGLIASLRYAAFGVPEVSTNVTPRGFTGREWSSATLNWYQRARYYDAALGRFLSLDPVPAVRVAGGGAYLYARDNPVRFVDHDGRSATAAGAAAAGFAAWAKICSDKAIGRSKAFYDPTAQIDTSFDKKKHCYVGCYITRCMLLGPGATFAMSGQLVWEFSSGWDRDASDDTRAAAFGTGRAFSFEGCKQACDSCPIKTK